MGERQRFFLAILVGSILSSSTSLQAQTIPALPKLTPFGENFVDPTSKVVKFWGANYAKVYPSTDLIATNLAKNLASRGINLVRFHHMREDGSDGSLGNPSTDWSGTAATNPNFGLFTASSRPAPTGKDQTSWNRFDRFNAELQRNGIYTMLSIDSTVQFSPLDSSVLALPADDAAWKAAILALRKKAFVDGWTSTIDLWKFLPLFDERAEQLQKEFVSTLLNRTNPITGVVYKNNPQILTLEIVNEFSSYYTFEQGNRFVGSTPEINGPLAYFANKLQNKYTAYRTAQGKAADDINNSQDPAGLRDFLLSLDIGYRTRMKTYLETLGATATVTFSSVWRSERDTKMSWETQPASSKPDGYTEDHIYGDPLVVEGYNRATSEARYSGAGQSVVTDNMLKDFTYYLSNLKAVAGKPYIVGELNIGDGGVDLSDTQKVSTYKNDLRHRTMMQLAAAAYGSLHNWSGIAWFAFQHGEGQYGEGAGITLGNDGWASDEAQDLTTAWPSNFAEAYRRNSGHMWSDGQRLDHMRTTGLMFRNSLVSKSINPKVLAVGPITTNSVWTYGAFEGTNLQVKALPGWSNVSSIRKTYDTSIANNNTQLTTTTVSHPVISDTAEITKDVKRQQLTVSAAKAEGFSGYFGSAAPANLKVLTMPGGTNTGQFGTVIVVSNDSQALNASSSLIVSRTAITGSGTGTVVLTGPNFSLKTLKAPAAGQKWRVRFTRPRAQYPTPTLIDAPLDGTGALSFTSTIPWTEAELVLDGTPTVPVVTAPTGTIATLTPTYTWTPVTGATSYVLRVDNTVNGVTTNNKQSATLTPTQAACTATQCSFKPTGTLGYGTATTLVTAVVGGVNKQSAGVTFTIPAPKPVVTAPTGTIATLTPTYTWTPATGATSYVLRVDNTVNGVTTTNKQSATLTPAQAACTATLCSFKPTGSLGYGTATTMVTAVVGGVNSQSTGVTFTIAAPPPANPVLITPLGAVTINPPTYKWTPVAGATWYNADIKNSSGVVIRQLGGAPTICSATECSILGDLLTSGTYTWNVSAWVPALNTSLDSGPGTITVGNGGTVPVAISPIGTLTANPASFTWSPATGASWYNVDVKNNSGVVVKQFGGDPTTICTATQCSYAGEVLSPGTYTWTISAWIPAQNQSAVSTPVTVVAP
jgi:hypothetical protein